MHIIYTAFLAVLRINKKNPANYVTTVLNEKKKKNVFHLFLNNNYLINTIIVFVYGRTLYFR